MKHLILLFIITSGLLITATGCSNECLFRHTNEEILLIDGGYDINHNRCIEHEEYYEFTKKRAIETMNKKEKLICENLNAWSRSHNKALFESYEREIKDTEKKIIFHVEEYILAKRRLSWWSRTFGSDIVTDGEILEARSDDLFPYMELCNW